MNTTSQVLDALTRTHVSLGRIAGVPVGLNASWFPVFFLVAWSLATGFIPHAAPTAGPETVWIAALIGTTLFFASILAHEFGHALVAMHAGIGVSSVTLFVLGGVSRIAEEPRTAWEELRIAAAGPLVSLATAGVFLGATPFLGGYPLAMSIAIYLVLVNAALALFNLLPALPLDGGRVLRALIWAATGDPQSATRWAAWSGRAIGGAFMAAGVTAVALGALVPAGWLLLLGLFVERSANASLESGDFDVHVQPAVSGLTVLSMNEARFRRLETKVIWWRARLDVLPRPGDLEAQMGDGSLVLRYQEERMRMYEILDGIDVGIRSLMTDEVIEQEFRKLDELHDVWRPAAFAGEADAGTPDAGEEAALAGRPDRYAPSPEDVLAREPGSSLEV